MLISKRRRDESIRRLLLCVRDLVSPGSDAFEALDDATGTAAHRRLFSAYIREARRVVSEAHEFWKVTVDAAIEEAGNKKRGTDAAWLKRPAGPASDPHFVALVRKYWLACHGLNQKVDEAQWVSPEVFLLQWAIDEGHDAIVEVLACMPYWPIGMSHQRHWV